MMTAALLLPPAAACALETIVVKVVVNSVPGGDLFVKMTPDRDFLVRTEDLRELGIESLEGEISVVDEEEHVWLRSLKGVSFVFREETLTLAVEADPSLLPSTSLDFASGRPRATFHEGGGTGYLNYRASYSADNSFEFTSFSLLNELGFRAGGVLFRTDSSYTLTSQQGDFTRLSSSASYDRRGDLQRFILGDFFASSGPLGSSLNLGGLSFRKVYKMDPYLVKQPLFDFTGLASAPSDIEVYLDGVIIKRERVQPGEFSLENLSAYGGGGNFEIVIRDLFGREERIRVPYYFSDTLLKKGLHEYGYNLGFIREGFGTQSNSYGALALSAFHRLGLTDSLTAGLGLEASDDVMSAGPSVSYLSHYGVTSLSAAASASDGAAGAAGTFSHVYQGKRFVARLALGLFSDDYSRVDSVASSDTPSHEAALGLSYWIDKVGAVSFDYAHADGRAIGSENTFSASFTRALFDKASFTTTYRNIREGASTENELFALFTYYPKSDSALSVNFQNTGGVEVLSFQAHKGAPYGEGLGYRATVQLEQSSSEFNPYLQYNAPRGVYTAEYRGVDVLGAGFDGSYELTASGAIAYAGGHLGLSRPVGDSFAAVKVSGLEGVSVMHNNQAAGKSRTDGVVFVPSIGAYYANQISIQPGELPINYSVDNVTRYISAPPGGGAFVEFVASKVQGVTGSLVQREGASFVPIEFVEGSVATPQGLVLFPTGRGGEFYLENLPPGAYSGTIERATGRCGFGFRVPESDEVVIELGEVVCAELI